MKDSETRETVKELLDVLVECSYKEFVRRATSCLVDHVVDEARKKCVKFVCGQGFDPSDLVEPVIPRRLRNQIRLERPNWPCTGPCAQFGKGDEWKERCCKIATELGGLHDELTERLTKKLNGDLKRILRDDDDALGKIQLSPCYACTRKRKML